MSRPQNAKPAKLVIGLLVNDKALLPKVALNLKHKFGAIDMISGWMDFDYTEYYATEMGTPLHRRMLTFAALIGQHELSSVKLATNDLETSYAIDGKRCVNIDPGYLLYERFVLATGKNYSHRIYIGQCIYADLTLIYQQGNYQPLPWTYPDYADAKMISFLRQVREKYAADLRSNTTFI
ncbi:MAG: DUF4416 family protein [Desulfobacteraceae bacterium]|jgi:hypothetical protein